MKRNGETKIFRHPRILSETLTIDISKKGKKDYE